MHDIAPHDRPREKLARAGAESLGDNELLAVVLGHGRAGASAFDLANRVLQMAGGLRGLPRLHHDQLSRMPGLGPAQAGRVQAGIELGRRTLVAADRDRPRLRSPADAARHLLPQYGAHAVERFGVALLDTRHRLISSRIISVGSLDASLAHPRDVFREAIVCGAAAIIAFHNHPSGDPTPSPDDIVLTARLRNAGGVLGVDLVDHVILADAQYCSMKERGFI